jgi:hypothetical protein
VATEDYRRHSFGRGEAPVLISRDPLLAIPLKQSRTCSYR